MKKIEIELDPVVAELLSAISLDGTPKGAIEQLIDHAQQGVYRPGAWEREWLCQAFGYDWQAKLEPGDPYGRTGMAGVFQRPQKT